MNKELAYEWADALESGKYKQGKVVLRTGDRFCCLGVLCEILGVPSEPLGDSPEVYVYGVESNMSNLPEEALKKAGLEYPQGFFNAATGIPPLTVLNDHGYSFVQIADVIRNHYEDLV